MRRAPLGLFPALLAGCPMCPCGEIEIVDGKDRRVAPGEQIQLEAEYGWWTAGPDDCGAYWYVNKIHGGNAAVGTIDTCGLYRAPAEFPDGLVELQIEAMDYAYDSDCADCCPYAVIALTPIR